MVDKTEALNKIQAYFDDNNQDELEVYLNDQLENESVDEKIRSFIHYHIGRLHYYKDNLKSAEEQFLKSIQCDSKNIHSLVYLGLIFEKSGMKDEALKLFLKCASRDNSYSGLFSKSAELAENIKTGFEPVDDVIKSVPKQIKDNDNPKISIIILCYNKAEYTLKCLNALFKNTTYPNYEVIVLDNASADDTPAYLEAYGNKIKFARSDSNLGFVGGNNAAFQLIEGEFTVFLNNDTEVLPLWLINLYNTFVTHPDAGAVGSMLIYPDGKLQEAGGIIFNNATGWNFGRNGDPGDPKYNFLREVDYCSGASLMVRSELFDRLGKFDMRFYPAYFEDTDLCFGIRKLGHKVYYCPFSRVIHYEGITSGTDLNSGYKKHQLLNTPKFIEKWNEELKYQYSDDLKKVYSFSNRHKGKRVLIIDDIPPFPDRAAGALRHYHTLKQLLELGCRVTYIHLMGQQYNDESSKKYFKEFKMQGVEFHWANYEGWWAIRETPAAVTIVDQLLYQLDLPKRDFDLVYIAFWYIAEHFIDSVRKTIPNVPILIDSMDIHYLRESREAEMKKDALLKKKSLDTKKRELQVYLKADCVTTVTEADRELLQKDLPGKPVFILTDVHEAKETKTTFEEREGLVFVGNFNHNPNEDAVVYFVEKIFPSILKKNPGMKFHVVGNNPTKKIKALQSENIIVTGWVPEVAPYLEKCKISVVPLRYGAGNKGKVGESLSYGVPMVSTTIGAEGMNIVSGEHSFVTDNPEQFAEYVLQLYSDKETWQKFSEFGKKLISSQYSSELMKQRLEFILNHETKESFKTLLAKNQSSPPKVSIILVTYNNWKYTRECIQSVIEHSGYDYEIILVDNLSTDNTLLSVEKEFPFVRIISNGSNIGFPAAVNKALMNALGEYILLLNNDTVVTEGWLDRLIKAIESDEKIGIVGPVSNEVSGVQKDKNAVYKNMAEMNLYAEEVGNQNIGEVVPFPRVAFLCTLIKKDLIDKIGGLDERFTPGNYEDDDFCLRAQLSGFKTVIAKDVFIHHYGSVSFKKDGDKKYAERLQVNRKKFVDKWNADPDEIWLKNKNFNTDREIYYPVNKSFFIQYFERAKLHIREKEYKLAQSALADAVKSYHSSDRKNYFVDFNDVINLAGNICLINHDVDKAAKYFEEELKITPNSAGACIGLGEVFFTKEMNDEARTMFEWALKIDPENESASAALSRLYELMGTQKSMKQIRTENKSMIFN